MLKFLRKYQLVVLAIGGTLLMLVFLLEPIITSFQRSQVNRTVARYGDGSKVSLMDFERARMEIELAKRVAHVAFVPVAQMGLGLDLQQDDSDDLVRHWMMLGRMAEEAGVVGGAEDGRLLLERELGFEAVLMQQQGIMAVMQGLIDRQQLDQMITERIKARRGQLTAEVRAAAAQMRLRDEDEIWRMLARFTGAFRLAEMYREMPAFSPAGARAGLREIADAIAVDAALIPGSALAPLVPDPTEAELQAFFEPRAGLSPADAPDGIGYTMPARVKLGWIVINRDDIVRSVPVDRVELRKVWEMDSQKPEGQRLYPGDFASERPRIEEAYRGEKADQVMIEADRAIRAEVAQTARRLTKQDDRYIMPEDWASTRPSLESVAQAVVARLAAQNITIPLPTVVLRDDAWLTGGEVAQLGGVGQAGYRVGSRLIMVQELPDQITAQGVLPTLGLQVGLTQAEPAAEDAERNRYYLLVTDHRVAGPAASIDDAGRQRVINDFKSLKGYERLAAMTDAMQAAALTENGVRGAIDAALAGVTSPDAVRPGVYPSIRVSKARVDPGTLARNVDPRINAPEFRDAVLAAGQGLDPLTTPEALASEPRAAVIPLPKSRSVAVARLIAPRPLTAEQFQTGIGQGLINLTAQTIGLTVDDPKHPFTLQALEARYGLKSIDKGKEDSDA